MKKSIFKFIIPLALVILTISYSCKKFLNRPLVQTLNASVLANKAGVDGLLIGAYANLQMNAANATGASPWEAGPDNWAFAGIASDDANKGSNATDQPDAAALMNHTVNSATGYVEDKWATELAGVQRANDVLRELPLVKDGSVTAAYATEVTAEARFLRGVFNMELSKVYRNVPYVDESITYAAGNYNVGNPGPIWDKIEADFTFAFTNLPATQAQAGRANKYAAEAFLAKAYMFEHKYALAKTALADLMTNGVTSNGAKYALVSFANNFNASIKNGPESVFAVQMIVGDGANPQGINGNPGYVLDFPAAGPATCCGFYQPSFSLVNAFKTDAVTGLPLLDGSFDNTLLKSDQGVDSKDATYLPDTTTPLDSRLDWTAGRRGIPFLDWGPMPGASWARAQLDAGPYINVKNIYRKAAQASTSDSYGGWATGQSDAVNFNMIRYSDVILMAAECEVEVGSLAIAEGLVNQVRTRAADPTGWVMGRLTGYAGGSTATPIVDNTLPAANYKVGLYTGQFAANGQAYARTAVQFERRLEFAMEGVRFFDLQRWDGLFGGPMPSGFMATTLNAYIKKNTSYAPAFFANTVLQGAVFTQGRNEIYPVPIKEISTEGGALKQNPGYN
ncbi:MAG: starch-binding outer membrane protein SusD/RagB family [Mucilaginibacter sp.]|nr:starch-binding outer membrane protein SusD/RagB family [Mucilaginibacter sp.]